MTWTILIPFGLILIAQQFTIFYLGRAIKNINRSVSSLNDFAEATNDPMEMVGVELPRIYERLKQCEDS